MEASRTTRANAAIAFDENIPEPCFVITMSYRYRRFFQSFLDEPFIEFEDVTSPSLSYSCNIPLTLVTRPTLLKDFAVKFLKSHGIDEHTCEALAAQVESLVNETSPVEEEKFMILVLADFEEIDVVDHQKATARLSTNLAV